MPMMTAQAALRRFRTQDGYTLYHLDGGWVGSLSPAQAEMAFDGGPEGPQEDTGSPLWGTLDQVYPVLRVDWIDGPRKGDVVRFPMRPVPGLIQVGASSATGWVLERTDGGPEWVRQVIEYAINEGGELDGSSRIADTIGHDDDADQSPNLTWTVEFVSDGTPPTLVGEAEMQSGAAATARFLSGAG